MSEQTEQQQAPEGLVQVDQDTAWTVTLVGDSGAEHELTFDEMTDALSAAMDLMERGLPAAVGHTVTTYYLTPDLATKYAEHCAAEEAAK